MRWSGLFIWYNQSLINYIRGGEMQKGNFSVTQKFKSETEAKRKNIIQAAINVHLKNKLKITAVKLDFPKRA